MADSTKETKDAIWRKKQEIQKEQGQRDEWASMVPAIEVSLTGFKEGSAEYIEWSSSLADAKTAINAHESTLAKLNEELAELEARLPKAPEQAAPKFDREKHPAFQRKAAEKQEPEQAVNFSIGEIVEAQWTDRAWYKAKIQSVLGSVSAPKYLVRFIEYDDTMTIDRSAVRPIQRKRKHDTEPATAPAPAMPAATGPHVISGPASINPNAQLAIKKTAGEDEDQEPKKKSRIANKKQLKERQSNWQQFQAKTAKKIPQKDSMFRTSTQAGSRVGFTGSGKGMTETRSRTRYDHKADAEKDEEYQEALHYRDTTSRDRQRY